MNDENVTDTFDTLENLALIENGLSHLQFELLRPQPSYFRVAREAHLVLCRVMIEALAGTTNAAISGMASKSVKYEIGNDGWREIHRVSISGCKKAWRFSKPTPCAAPKGVNSAQVPQSEWLIRFYDALAMIQTDCFMRRFVQSKIVQIADDDMSRLEWLHESVRNEYEHFMPKLYVAAKQDLIDAASLALAIADKLLFDSGTVVFGSIDPDALKKLLQSILLIARG